MNDITTYKNSSKFGRYTPYSHSKCSLHEDCPRKFKIRYLDKVKIEADQTHFEKGRFYHWCLEHYPIVPPGPYSFQYTPTAKQQEYLQTVKRFINHSRTQYLLKECENRREVEVVFWGDTHNGMDALVGKDNIKWDSMAYGYVDYMGSDAKDGHTIIVDWKSSEPRDRLRLEKQDRQLEMYALWAFLYSRNINMVDCQFGYVQDGYYKGTKFYREKDFARLFDSFINRIQQVESDSEFKRKITKNCKWCEYVNHCNPYGNMGA